MGSLETQISVNLLRSSSSSANNNNKNSSSSFHSFYHKPRSRFSRFLLFKKLDYLQWICTVAVFFFFVLIFQIFLPASVLEKENYSVDDAFGFSEIGGSLKIRDSRFMKFIDGLDFGDHVKFEPSKLLLGRFHNNRDDDDFANRTKLRFGLRKPLLAFVFADLVIDPQQILIVSVAAALKEIGYEIEVYSIEDGPVHKV